MIVATITIAVLFSTYIVLGDEVMDKPETGTVNSVKDAVAVLPMESVALIMYVPFGKDGIVKDRTNEPDEDALTFPTMSPL
jgi:hypothetical protein